MRAQAICEVCGASFSKSCHLLRHEKVHSKDRPHVCKLCDQPFARSDALKRHIRLKHTGQDDPTASAPQQQLDRQEAGRGAPASEGGSEDGDPEEMTRNESRRDVDDASALEQAILTGSGTWSTSGITTTDPTDLTFSHAGSGEAAVSPSSLPLLSDLADRYSRTLQNPPQLAASRDAHAASRRLQGAEQGHPSSLDHHEVAVPSLAFAVHPRPTDASTGLQHGGPADLNQGYFDWDAFLAFDTSSGVARTAKEAAGVNGWSPFGVPQNVSDIATQELGDPSWDFLFSSLHGSLTNGIQSTMPSPEGADSLAMLSQPFTVGPSRVVEDAAGAQLASQPRVAPALDRKTPSSSRPLKLTADTWQADVRDNGDGEHLDTDGQRLERANSPEENYTTPEQVVQELRVSLSQVHDPSLLPSMQFLDSCMHLYFRAFHPAFPILHQPTFRRNGAPRILLLSICSIGCMFIGTAEAQARGERIYEQLHIAIVATQKQKMHYETTRVAAALASLLGQCYSFLSGKSSHMHTAEGYHGWLNTCFRRAGILRLFNKARATAEAVRDCTTKELDAIWKDWAFAETLRRACLGLTVQAAEATVYSGLPRLLPIDAKALESFNDSTDGLFKAKSAEEWRDLLTSDDNVQHHHSRGHSGTSDPFLPLVQLCQKMVDIHTLRRLQQTSLAHLAPDPQAFYEDMLSTAVRLEIPLATEAVSSRDRILATIWHYCCLHRLCRMELVAAVAGREGIPTQSDVDELVRWMLTQEARLAYIHCGAILLAAADLRDLAFLVPRAIFEAALLLFCYLTHVRYPRKGDQGLAVLDVTGLSDWARYGRWLKEMPMLACVPDDARTFVEITQDTVGSYLWKGEMGLRIPGFTDGRDWQLDRVSLLSDSILLLRRCTSWGIGQTLGDILARLDQSPPPSFR